MSIPLSDGAFTVVYPLVPGPATALSPTSATGAEQ